jgi:hypothetical protein
MSRHDHAFDVPVLGRMSPIKAAAKLRELGEEEAASALHLAAGDATRLRGFQWPFQNKPWQYTSHAFGYLAPNSTGNAPLPIKHAGNIEADASLKGARIRITLNRMRVAAYPGKGIHQILFDFYGQNQVPKNVEHLHFNATYRAQEGQEVGVIGYPIFVGLHVGAQGVAFECSTINVKNEDDEAFVRFLDSDVFKAGLRLVTTAQPAIGPFSAMALGLTKAIATRSRNVPVQRFIMGLDFSRTALSARLAEGDYIAVQIPDKKQSTWDWSEWTYNPVSGQIVNRADLKQLIPYNYIAFGVNRFEGD